MVSSSRNPQFGSSSIADFFGWINERHAIYLRRQRGDKWPWTADKILQENKFTNAFRELDRGTVALKKMIEDKDDGPLKLFNIFWYRLLNLDTHVVNVGWAESYDQVHKSIRLAESRGDQLFTSAHLTSSKKGMSKIDAYLIAIKQAWDKRQEFHDWLMIEQRSLEDAFERFKEILFVGPFISYEIVSDIRWTGYLQNAPDILSWANIGPGCARGLLRLGLEKSIESLRYLHSIAPEYLEEYVAVHYPSYNHQTGNRLMDGELPYFELREIEHSLCEFDKYERVRKGEGQTRCRYRPPQS